MSHTMFVCGAGGGAGASTVAAAVAVRANAAGQVAVLVDCDPLSGGLDVTLGVETVAGLRWPALVGSDGELDGAALLARLPHTPDGLAVLSHTARGGANATDLTRRAIEALSSVCDLVVVDAGRNPAPLHAACPLIVASGNVRGLAALSAVLATIGGSPQVILRDPPRGVAAMVEHTLDVSVVDEFESDTKAGQDAERGLPPGSRERSPITALADRLLREASCANRLDLVST